MKKIWLFLNIMFLSLSLFFVLPSDAQISGEPSHLVFINEVMTSNQTIAPDQEGLYHDWIELYNPNDLSVNLSGYFISDRYDDLYRFELPTGSIISARGYLLIYASNKDGLIDCEIHTNFAINQSKEPIILSSPNGQLVDYVPPIFIPSNYSYGRLPDGTMNWAFFSTQEATPNASNNLATPTLMPSELNPIFSHQGGFYNEAFYLELTPKPNTTIYYTLDGSDPTANDLVYHDPIYIEKQMIPSTSETQHIIRTEDMTEIPIPTFPISHIVTGSQRWKSPSKDTFKATVIKAKAIGADGFESETVTHTYFVDEDIENRYTFPIMSISTDINHLFGYETGINVPGIHYDPTIPEEGNGNRTGNYFQRGDAWERPIYIEYYETNGVRVLAQNAGIRIHGGLSRKYPIKSYRLYARSEYDQAHSSFDYPFFSDKDIDTYKRLVLRGGGQAYQYTFMGEAAAHELLKPLNLDIQYNQPVILFINGEYFGIRNLRDRLDEWHLSIHYGGDRNNFTLLTGNAFLDSGSIEGQAHYLDLYMNVTRNNMNDAYYYDHVITQMDIDNFIDYYIAQLYLANVDWPQNNILYWRYNVPYDPQAPKGLDGRWRWMVFDVDASFGISWGGYYPEYNSFERITGDDWRTGNMFVSLLRNENFYKQYINRFADLLNTRFSSEEASQVVAMYKANYIPEMQEHIDRFGFPSTYSSWLGYVNRMQAFATDRPQHIIEQMIAHYELIRTREIRVYGNLDQGDLKVNSLTLNPNMFEFNHFSGIYFEAVPVTVSATPKSGYRFKGWYNQFNQLISMDMQTEIDLSKHRDVIARFEVGDPIIPPDPEPPYVNESLVLYISIFVMSSVIITAFILEQRRKKNMI